MPLAAPACFPPSAGVLLGVVVAQAIGEGKKRLVGFVSPASADPIAVRVHCAASLLPTMVPAAVVVLPELPLLPNGKVDMKALPLPERGAEAGASQEVYEPPANKVCA